MLDIIKEALKNIVQNSPMTIVLVVAIWYLYRELKESRQLIRELYSMRVQDIKEISSSQDDLNDSISDLVEEIDDGEGQE